MLRKFKFFKLITNVEIVNVKLCMFLFANIDCQSGIHVQRIWNVKFSTDFKRRNLKRSVTIERSRSCQLNRFDDQLL